VNNNKTIKNNKICPQFFFSLWLLIAIISGATTQTKK
jgi:hypothetical protein